MMNKLPNRKTTYLSIKVIFFIKTCYSCCEGVSSTKWWEWGRWTWLHGQCRTTDDSWEVFLSLTHPQLLTSAGKWDNTSKLQCTQSRLCHRECGCSVSQNFFQFALEELTVWQSDRMFKMLWEWSWLEFESFILFGCQKEYQALDLGCMILPDYMDEAKFNEL